MALTKSATKGVPVVLLAAATSGTGDTVVIPAGSNFLRIDLIGAGTISGGTLLVEEAGDPAYSGTWSLLYTLTVSALTGGAELCAHVIGCVGAIRVRITSNITGGGTLAANLTVVR
jgi:hypothetical protein